MKKNIKISEYALVKKVINPNADNKINENTYYAMGNTLVKFDGQTYIDLCTNKPIKLFDFQSFANNEMGIMFEKDAGYYERYVTNICNTYNKRINELILEIKELLKTESHEYSTVIKKYLTYVSKSLCLNKIVVLKALKGDFNTKDANRLEIYKLLEKIIKENEYYFKLFLHYNLNARILSDLNDPVKNRINPRKSIMLYEEENGIINDTKETWQELNSYKNPNPSQNANNLILKKSKHGIFQKLIAKL